MSPSDRKQANENAAKIPEPVVRSGDKIQIHCPECNHLGTHLGTCSWSQMRSGGLWAFFAENFLREHGETLRRLADDA